MKLALALLLALAACTAVPEPPAGLPPADACGAAALAGVVGRNVSEVALPEDRPLRVIPPGTAVTMDYSAARLNVETDADGRITRVYCG